MFKDLTTKEKLIVYTIIIVIVFIASYYVYKALHKKKIENLLTNNYGTVNTNQLTVNIGLKASEINDALHGSWYSEDEQKAINAVLSTPKPLIPQLSSTYFALTGINLNEDLQYYLSATEYLQIKSQFE